MREKIPIKIECHLGQGDVWVQASSERITFYDLSDGSLRLSVPVPTDSEKERVIGALLDVAEFLGNKLAKTEWP